MPVRQSLNFDLIFTSEDIRFGASPKMSTFDHVYVRRCVEGVVAVPYVLAVCNVLRSFADGTIMTSGVRLRPLFFII